jgi:hypothetical protein
VAGVHAPVRYPSEEGLQTVIDSLAEEVPEVARMQPAAMMDVSLLRELEAEGVIAGLYR